jgi:hypothetical protein
VIAGVSVAAVMLAVVVALVVEQRVVARRRAAERQVARRDRLARADRAVSKLPVPLQVTTSPPTTPVSVQLIAASTCRRRSCSPP